jgi:hypothetical protein
MFCRSIVFTKTPLLKAFRYRDKFQLVPIIYAKNAPLSIYVRHFPAFLEFQVEDCEMVDPFMEKVIKEKGLPEELIKQCRVIPGQNRIRKEIIQILSVFTNFLFFEYASMRGSWGIMTPFQDFDKLDDKTASMLNNQTSSWYVNAYVYPGLKDDLAIEKLTECSDYYEAVGEPMAYFTVNPNLENNPEIKIPPYLDLILDGYYSLDKELGKRVRQIIGLLYDGIELFDIKRSISLLSIISSIEGIALIDYQMYGQTPNLGAKNRVLRYLKRYVAGKSGDKFASFYAKRCNIAHEGSLFLGDVDPFGDIDEQDKDWLFRMEVMQVARLALYNWMGRKLGQDDD